MTEYVPSITSKKLDFLIDREFEPDEMQAVKDILLNYTSESEAGRNRVLAGIIKLSEGDLDRLKHNLELAVSDFRDIVSWAESPLLSKDPFNVLQYKDKASKLQILKADSEQYRNWLNREVSSKLLNKILKVGLATSIRGSGISISQALSEIDFNKYKTKVKVEDLKNQINSMPEVIEEWFCYSEDKRTTGGWYLLRNLKIGTLMDTSEEIPFRDSSEAVANYVMKELTYWTEKSA